MSAIASRKHQTESNKLTKPLRRQTGQAIADFNVIEHGNRDATA